MTARSSGPKLAAELEDLRARLAEAEEALRAIRNGEVDGVVVSGVRGEQVYTLSGADRIYRQLIEEMSEGAVILSADGVILYSNVRLAEMLGRPLDQVLGAALRDYLPRADQQSLDAILAQARTQTSRREINLKASEGRMVPVYLSASRLQGEEAKAVFCLVLTDLTEQKSHEQIVAAERLARLILEQVAEAVVVCDQQGRVTRASQAAERFCDGSPLLRPFAEVFPLRTDGPDPFHLAPVMQGETLRNVDVALDRQGQKLALILNAGPLLSGQQIVGCVVTLTNITERKNHEQKIARLSRIHAVLSGINSLIVRVRDRRELFKGACRIAIEQGGFGITWIGTLDPNTLDMTPVAWAGIDSELLTRDKLSARSDVPAGQGAVGRAIREKWPAVIHDFTSAPYPVGPFRKEAIRRGYRSLAVFPLLVDDSPVGTLTLFAQEANFFTDDELKLLDELAGDISFALQSMARQEKLDYLAYYDALTGLPNRALFDDRMAQQVRAASHEKSKTALVLIDLERFRVVNDTLGRSAADELLKLVAARLQSVIFDRDSLARVHGDVFAILFSDIKDEADIARIVDEKIIACLSEPFTLAGQDVRVSAKAGVALFPGDALVPDALFICAEAALRQAKDSSDRYLFYARHMNARVAERLKLENKLQRALKQEEFVLFYQPKVDLRSGGVTGLEALIRWNDPGTGLVMPMLFTPLLEETGMIVEVGAWAMKQAVSQYAAWQAAGLQPPRIAVNVSQVQLTRKDFVTSVQQAIAIAGKPDHGLDLEITEGMIMADIESSIGKLKLVRELGVGIAIDDFGTGHSSLRYLTRLPLTALKIDLAFVWDMTTNPDNMAIVSTIITLARTMKLKVIAEGVETEEQSKLLRLLKCDEMQGYLFSKPVPAEQVPALLARGEEKQ